MLHEKLKQARMDRGLKQSDVASQIGCATTSFTHWENGRVNPPLEQLEKVCGIYGISPLDLLDHRPTMGEIYRIACKALAERTYEENVAIAFSKDVSGWVPDEKDPKEEELVRMYRNLPDVEKDVVFRMLRGLAGQAPLM